MTTIKQLGITDLLALLPHRYPFVLIDRVTELTENKSIVALKNVTINEPFFPGHFPDDPVMPGVLIVEAMAQTAAAYSAYAEGLETDGKVVLFMGIDKAKFRRPVVPGDQLELHVAIETRRPPVWKYKGVAKVDGQVVAEAEYKAMLTEPK